MAFLRFDRFLHFGKAPRLIPRTLRRSGSH